MCVGDLASSVAISVHNVSQHLRVLKEHKVVRSRKEGQTVFYAITNQKFVEACTLIRQAIIEQHQAEGEFLLAAGLLDEAEQQAAATSAGTP
jgi:ArsR family transcriptional regulator, virulence genes transcriptional regulator